jgi:peptidyl-prolyl cis-trans isomerase C
MKIRILVAALVAAPALALAQAPAEKPAEQPAEKPAAKPAAKGAAKPAAKGGSGAIATVNGVAIPRSRADIMMRQQAARGGQDNDQMRSMVREELINRELIAQEAVRSGVTKNAEVQAQLDLVRQEVLVGSFIREWVAKHPISDADLQKEYDRARSQTGDKEYRARHILLETEDQAKGMVAELKKGGKFDELATKNSKDGGTAQRGGDLDWNVPSAYDKVFSDAMVKLEKGKYTDVPVHTRFGYHVILLEDVRPVKFPSLEEVKPRLQQQLVQARIQELVKSLRAKAKIE